LVVDNRFFVNPNDSFQISGAGTSNLKVRNGVGEEILDVEFFNPHVIKITGTFFGPGGEKAIIGEDRQLFQSRTGASVEGSFDCYGGSSTGTIDMTPAGPILIR
jgi:hypothetical protein